MSTTEHKELALFDALETLGVIIRIKEKTQYEYKIDTFEYPSGRSVTMNIICSSLKQAKINYIEYAKLKCRFIIELAEFIVNDTITNVVRKKYVLNYKQAGHTFEYYINPSKFWQVYNTIYDVIVERAKSL